MLHWLLDLYSLVLFVAVTYNRFVRGRNRVENAWAQVEVQVQVQVRAVQAQQVPPARPARARPAG